MQEIDVNSLSAPGFINSWRTYGYKVLLGELQSTRQLHRVALASKLPIKQVQLEAPTAAGRFAAGLLDITLAGSVKQLLCIAFYGYPGQLDLTSQAFREILSAAGSFGGLFCIWGDYNQLQTEGAVAEAISRAMVRPLDECRPDAAPTGPARKRRIDFGLAHHRLWAGMTANHEYPDISDHALVSYDISEAEGYIRQTFCAPAFQELTTQDPEAIERAFEQHWDANEFNALLAAGDVDAAWGLLSDTGEMALGAKLQEGAKRGSGWDPIPLEGPRGRAGACGHESGHLRLLRKLRGQLHQLRVQPHCPHRWRRASQSVASLRGFNPGLPHVDLHHHEHNVAWIDDLYAHQASLERGERIRKWREETIASQKQTFSWIKRSAHAAWKLEQPAPDAENPPRIVHPARILEQQAKVWRDRWAPPERPVQPEALDDLLASLPEPAQHTSEIDFSPEDLVRAARAMQGKSPGPDQWSPELLLRLPGRWWEELAKLWHQIWQQGQTPRVWRRSVIALLEKPNQETRPVALCSVLWRIGARLINRQLRGWLETWLGPDTPGAAPGRSAQDAYARLLIAQAAGNQHYVKQDISAFFDSLQVPALCRLMRRLGAPPQLERLITSFYDGSLRLFKHERYIAPKWESASKGIMQGCPLSPSLALMVGHLWASYCLSSDCRGIMFVDDRVLWPRPRTQNIEASLRHALQRCCHFDDVWGLTCKPSKCAVIQPSDSHVLDHLAALFRYEVLPKLEFLGVSFSVQDFSTSLLEFNLQVLHHRLRYLKLLKLPMDFMFQALQALVYSSMTWAAGVALPDSSQLKDIQQDIRALLQNSFTQETPLALVHAAFGFRWDPAWTIAWRSLETAVRTSNRPGLWRDAAGLDEATAPWFIATPMALNTLQELRWYLSPDGKQIWRHDDAGQVRYFWLGFDSPQVLQRWLSEEFQRRQVHATGRVRRSCHRQGEDLARGLSLPAPPKSTRHALRGHGLLCRNASLEVRRAAVATGATVWYHKERTRQSQSTQLPCICGKLEPSRPHIVWQCSATQHLREDLEMPADRVQERLFGFPISEYPASPPGFPLDEFYEEVADSLVKAFSRKKTVWIATDGSSKDDIGAAAIIGEDFEHASGDGLEDQTAFRYELMAVLWLLRALWRHGSACQGDLHALCDCQAVHMALANPHRARLGAAAGEAADLLTRLRLRGLRVTLHWVPSHGTHRHWSPPEGIDDLQARAMNAKADETANACRHRRHQGSARVKWYLDLQRATSWERKAILAAARASELLSFHIQDLRGGNSAGDDAAAAAGG